MLLGQLRLWALSWPEMSHSDAKCLAVTEFWAREAMELFSEVGCRDVSSQSPPCLVLTNLTGQGRHLALRGAVSASSGCAFAFRVKRMLFLGPVLGVFSSAGYNAVFCRVVV